MSEKKDDVLSIALPESPVSVPAPPLPLEIPMPSLGAPIPINLPMTEETVVPGALPPLPPDVVLPPALDLPDAEVETVEIMDMDDFSLPPDPVAANTPLPMALDLEPTQLSSSKLPSFLDDLPAPVAPPGIDLDSSLLAGLPQSLGAPPPTMPPPPFELDTDAGGDLPAPVLEDLPAPVLEDIPLDVGDLSSPTTTKIPIPPIEDLSLSLDEAPALMDDLAAAPVAAVATDQSQFNDITTKGMLPPQILAEARGKESAPKPPYRRLRAVILASLLLLVVGAGAAIYFVGPKFGIVLPGQTVVQTQAKPKPPPVEKKAVEEIKEVKAEKVEAAKTRNPVPVLGAENVSRLSYADLKKALAALPPQENSSVQRNVVAYANYRLAVVFQDPDAFAALAALPPPPKAANEGSLYLAAAVGKLVREGKIGPAQKMAEKFLKTRYVDSPELTFVLATTLVKATEQARAQKLYEQVLAQDPAFSDAAMARANLLFARRAVEDGMTALNLLLKNTSDPDLLSQALALAFAAGQIQNLEEWAAKLGDLDREDSVAPPHRALFYQWLLGQKVRSGDLSAALAVAKKRVAKEPDAPHLLFAMARLSEAVAKDGDAVLKAAEAVLKTPPLRAQSVAERVRFALAKKDLEAARALLLQNSALGQGPAAGWIKYARGLIAEHEGNVAQAQKYYSSAGAPGKAGFEAAQAALLSLPGTKAAPAMAKLTQAAKSPTGGSLADYALAKVMAEHGNVGGAAALLDKILWTDPTVADSLEMVMRWIDYLDKAGQNVRATAAATALHSSRPEDVRPVQQLIDLAQRNNQEEALVEWHRVLSKMRPENIEDRLSLADALSRAGKGVEAERLIADLIKSNPKAKTPEALTQLGHAWFARDPIKARNFILESNQMQPRAGNYAMLGDLEQKLGRIDEAQDAYKKAVELDPNQIECRLKIGSMLMATGKADDAVSQLREVFKAHPNDAKIAELLGDALDDTGNSKEAAQMYQTAALAVGDKPQILMKLARLQLEKLDQAQPALKTLRRIVKSDRTFAEAHYYLGLALKDQGKVGEAKRELESYVALAPAGEFVSDAKRFIDDLEKL